MKITYRLKQFKSDINEEIKSDNFSQENINSLFSIVDARIEKLGNSLRKEMEETLSQYRAEMEKIHEQELAQMKSQALYQWLITIALGLGLLIKLLLN